MSERLETARVFETRYRPFIQAEERPAFHLTPTIDLEFHAGHGTVYILGSVLLDVEKYDIHFT